MNLGDKPAFPGAENVNDPRSDGFLSVPGMTLRQYYAGEAMMGILSDHKDVPAEEWPKGATSCPEAVAMLAVQHADELIAALEEPPAS